MKAIITTVAILMAIAVAISLTGCSTISKTSTDKQVSRDTSSHIQAKTNQSSDRDSSSLFVDKGIISNGITSEGSTIAPGGSFIFSHELKGLTKPLVTADSSGNVVVFWYDAKDSTVTVSGQLRPVVDKWKTTQTFSDNKNLQNKIAVSTSASAKTETSTNSAGKSTVKQVDNDKTIKRSIMSSPAFIVGGILVFIAAIYFVLKKL